MSNFNPCEKYRMWLHIPSITSRNPMLVKYAWVYGKWYCCSMILPVHFLLTQSYNGVIYHTKHIDELSYNQSIGEFTGQYWSSKQCQSDVSFRPYFRCMLSTQRVFIQGLRDNLLHIIIYNIFSHSNVFYGGIIISTDQSNWVFLLNITQVSD